MAKMSERAKGRRADTLFKKALAKSCKKSLPGIRRMVKKHPTDPYWRGELKDWQAACGRRR